MTRPTVLDMNLVVVPREATDEMLEPANFGYSPDKFATLWDAMLSTSPYPTAWDDVRKYVEWLEEEVGRLEDENSELRYEPWPEWARAVLKVIRSHTGYDGYDDATDGVDMPLELSEHLSQVESDTDRWKARAFAAEARIAELEKRLADAEKIVKCMVDWENGMAPLSEDFRAARSYMEGK